MKRNFDLEIIARKFSEYLKRDMGKDNFNEMVRKHINGNYAFLNVCLSHDYVDANQTMLDVFTDLYNIDMADSRHINSDKYISIWDNAWNLAKIKNFYNLG
jgi:ribosome biogenesis protein Nip4